MAGDIIQEVSGKYVPPVALSEKAYVKDMEQYKEMYKRSIEDREGFWSEKAEEFLTWNQKWDKVVEDDFVNGKIEWFKNGKLNASYNCLDRHLETRGDQPAIIWEGNEPTEDRTYTYKQVYDEVNHLANVLKKHGVKKGDRVTLYMPMVPELAFATLACSRIGAPHSVIFGGFSADSIKDRVQDAKSNYIITSDGAYRGKKKIPMKATVDTAVKECPTVEKVLVLKRTGVDVGMKAGRDFWYHEEMAAPDVQAKCEPEIMDAEDPLFLLYTSGSTGKPKGVLHTTGGYLLWTAFTHKYVFDYKEGDVFWCTADIGWVTGHSYIVYGPLINGATTVMFEGVPSYPDFSRFWAVVDKWKVNSFYTAPTAIRACMKEGDEWVNKCSLSSLKVLGTVGEPINPEAWNWYHKIVGKERCPIVDTWWQTETGGHLITPLPGAIPTKPGSATLPFFGVEPLLMDEKGKILEGATEGALVIKRSWPGMMRTVYNHEARFKETYFSMFPGYYFSGDGARRDEDGYFWITGRMDDVINVSGHRMGTAEVESALVSHPLVAESAVVGCPHEIKGQGIYAYVILKTGSTPSDELKKELRTHVRKEIGPIATPDKIQFVDGLPKTRSGKIMRRILRKVAAHQVDQLGDTSTLADPEVVEHIVDGRQ